MNETRDESLGGRYSNGTEPSPTKRGATREKVIARCGRASATRIRGAMGDMAVVYSDGCDIELGITLELSRVAFYRNPHFLKLF